VSSFMASYFLWIVDQISTVARSETAPMSSVQAGLSFLN